MTAILGVNCFSHDTSACLLVALAWAGGDRTFAEQESPD